MAHLCKKMQKILIFMKKRLAKSGKKGKMPYPLVA